MITNINLVPVSMLNNRSDTPKRVATYVKRGFACAYLQDDLLHSEALAKIEGLQQRVQEALVFEKKLFAPFVLNTSDSDDIDEELTARYLAESNTTYSSSNIPRMVELTSSCIKKFFENVGGSTAASLLTDIDDIPAVQPKLRKVSKESWVSWGMT